VLSTSSVEDFWTQTKNEEPTPSKQIEAPHLVFKNVKRYADTVLKTSSILEFDRVCDILLDPSKDIGPLLLHYD
jgi:hypothetical protein